MKRIVYRVLEGETLEKIAAKYSDTPQGIASRNRLSGDEVYWGMRLVVERREGRYHVVAPFETAHSIAAEYGVDEAALIRLNGERFFLGQRLFIPLDKTDSE